ncbi:MAG: glycosyltransferase family 39 protein [Nitrososphaerales archaeon]|nr:glycosyltransferase family 39 protein [Nitrososphaerales archaeon]
MQVPEVAPTSPSQTRWKRVLRYSAVVAIASLLALCLFLILNAHSPSAYFVVAAQASAVLATLGAAAAVIAGARHFTLTRPEMRWAVLFLVLVSVAVFGAHLYVINSPPTTQCTNSTKLGCIMDEVFYVPAAQTLLSGNQCAPYADNCNLEHPFLAKALIAAGTAVFGSNDLGWRVFNALLGTLSIPLLFVLIYLLSGNRRLSYFSAFLFSVDTMFFVHSSAALIDIPSIFFSLLAFVLYFWRARFWRIDNVTASGAMLGLALLSKETAVFAVAVLFTYQLIFAEGTLKHAFIETAKLLAVAALVFFAGLQVYDTLFTSATVPTFVQQVAFIFKYGSGLDCPPAALAVVPKCGMWVDSLFHAYITPLNWLTYYPPVSYFVTTVTTTVGSGPGATSSSFIGVGYYGVNNVIMLWAVLVWVPLAVYRLLRRRPEGEPVSRDDRTTLFLLVWLVWTYLPYIGLWLYGRVTYPFYILPAVPALSAGAAYFSTREWFPRWLAVVYLLAALVWFVIYFPVKDFLPVILRVWLGR